MKNTQGQSLKFQFQDTLNLDFFKQKESKEAPIKEDNADNRPTNISWTGMTLREVTDLKWLVVIPWAGIVEFNGESIPGILTVDGCYTPPEEVQPKQSRVWKIMVRSLDGRTADLIHCSVHFSALSKQAWVAEFREVLKGWCIPDDELSDERIVKALVTIFQDHAVKVNEYQKKKGRSIKELLERQDRLAHAIHLDLPFIGIED